MPKAILHIGTEKTGTSTLQIFLQANRARLNANGFHYPAFPGSTQQTKLAAYAQEDREIDDLRIDLGIRDARSLSAFRERFEADARAEVAAHPDKTFIMSSEHCSSRLNGPPSVSRLKGLLDQLFDEVEIAVYLRRQDQVAVSLYSTFLKYGAVRDSVLPDPHTEPGRWDYRNMLSFWEGAFGRERVHPRIFDRAELAGGSIVEDFRVRWGLGTGFVPVRDANESIEPVAGEVLLRLNPDFPPYLNTSKNPMRGELGAWIGNGFPGRGIYPARADAEAFYKRFAEINEAVRREWFPERETLFSEDFGKYPETSASRAFGFDDAVRVTAELWRQARAHEINLHYDIAILKGQIAELEGRWDEAVAFYAAAHDHNPKRGLAQARQKGALAAKAKALAEDRARAQAQFLARPADGEVAGPGPSPDTAPPDAPLDQSWRAAEMRWSAQDRRAARRAKLRKLFSLNGIRRLIGVQPK